MEMDRYSAELNRALIRQVAAENKSFQSQIHRNPNAAIVRAVYADYLQEKGLHHDDATLEALRNPNLVSVQVHTLPSGKVWAGRNYGIVGIQRHNQSEGYHWFSPDTMRGYGTRLNDEVFHGPGGVYFVTSDYSGFDRQGREYTVRHYNPETGNVGTAEGPDGERLTHDSLAGAKRLAKSMALTERQKGE